MTARYSLVGRCLILQRSPQFIVWPNSITNASSQTNRSNLPLSGSASFSICQYVIEDVEGAFSLPWSDFLFLRCTVMYNVQTTRSQGRSVILDL